MLIRRGELVFRRGELIIRRGEFVFRRGDLLIRRGEIVILCVMSPIRFRKYQLHPSNYFAHAFNDVHQSIILILS